MFTAKHISILVILMLSIISGSSAQISWGSSADWDNALSENNVVHENAPSSGNDDASVLKKGYSHDNPPYSNAITGDWPMSSGSSTTLHNFAGSNGNINGATPATGGVLGGGKYAHDGDDDYMNHGIGYPSDNQFTIITWVNNNGRTNAPNQPGSGKAVVNLQGTGSPGINERNDDGGDGDIKLQWNEPSDGWTLNPLPQDIPNNEWVLLAGVWDGASSEARIVGWTPSFYETNTVNFDGLDSGSKDAEGDFAESYDRDSSNSGNQNFYGDYSNSWVYHEALTNSEIDKFIDVATEQSSLTTNWKTFSTNRDVNSLQLENVQSSLNGEDITFYVETQKGETSNAISLDGGGGPYTVSGLSTEENQFRLDIRLDNSDVTSTPTLSGVDLTGDSLNSQPNNPSNPNPSDNADTVGLNPNLGVDVSDPDGDSTDVTFYHASDDSQIGTDSNVVSGGMATVQASNFDQTGTTYSWYAVADDGSATTRGPNSGSWSFTTEGEPQIDEASASPQGGSVVSTTPDLSVNVSHPDGRTMDVTFFLNGEAFGTDQQVDGSGTASIQTPDLNASEIYDWYVVVDDRNGYTVDNSGSPWSFETDSGEPNISVDYGNSTNFNPDRAVIDVVPGHSHADTVDYVRLLDGSSTVIDEVQNVQVGQPVSLLWEDLNEDQSYDFRAEIEHQGETSQTSLMSFTTLTVDINLAGSVNNAESYSIYRRKGTSGDQASFDYGNSDYRFIGSSSSLSLTDATSDLETGDYCYVATASNLGGESPPSAEACITGVQVNP